MTESANALQRAVDRLTNTIEQLRTELVRKDVYESDQRSRDRELHDLRGDVEGLVRKVDQNEQQRRADRKADEDKAAANRRLIIASFIAPFIVALLLLYVAAQIGSAPA